ncbi:Uma2 family endonuclease [Botrimarina sp.]|uniref:Uma2 family endonuclease n=1 Tax=Botrimarina sp. TaxID=2795802 RepID=UPI0032EFA058
MSTAPARRLTAQEYLRIERASVDQKHEFYAGEMFAMAGESFAHSTISAQIIRLLGNALDESPCDTHTSDMRVKVERTGLMTYPDASVSCGDPKFEDGHKDMLLNPVLVVEVLSKSTENNDRTRKFDHYRQIPSLREYLLVAQDEPRIDRFSLMADGRWALDSAEGLGAAIRVDVADAELPLAEVYRRVTFGEDS